MPSRSGEITFKWGDGPHTFRLDIAGWRELEDKLSIGPPELLERIAQKRWRVNDCREVLRVALWRGGMDPIEALTLVERYVDERPLNEWVLPTLRILNCAFFGLKETEKKEHAEARRPRQLERRHRLRQLCSDGYRARTMRPHVTLGIRRDA